MTNTSEGWHTLADGSKVYTKTWQPEGPPVARLVFVHGFSDHCNTYGVLFPTLAFRNIEVRAFDQRGWGRSVTERSQRGLCGSTQRVLDDITSFLQTVLPSDLPLFLMGHSMGGAEVMTYAAQGPLDVRRQISGYLVESPLIAFPPSQKPFRLTVTMGRLASKVMPNRQLVKKLDPNLMSRDPEVAKAFADDELCHDTGTLEAMAGMLDRAAGLESGKIVVPDSVELENGEKIKTRIWASHGTHDQVCNFDGTKTWFERLAVEDKTFRVYEGWYHKLHAEPNDDKYTFAKDVGDWILLKCSQLAGSDGAEPAKSKL